MRELTRLRAIGAILLCGCGSGPVRDLDGGGVSDANSPSDRAFDPTPPAPGLARRCPRLPTPCFETSAQVSVPYASTGGRLHDAVWLNGLYLLHTQRGEGSFDGSWQISIVSDRGSVAAVVPLSAKSSALPWGGALGVEHDEVLAATREPFSDAERGDPIGYDTTLFRVDATRVAPDSGRHRALTLPDQGGDVAVDGARVATAAPEALVVSSLDGTNEVRVASPHPSIGELLLRTVADDASVIVWSEDEDAGFARSVSTHAAVITREGVASRSRIFDAAPFASDAALVVIGQRIWIARYDLDVLAVRESRIRIAELGLDLERAGEDRWFSGWGGLVPQNVVLVEWAHAPWAIWRTIDARYGARAVLHVQPISSGLCGREVDAAAVAWPGIAGGELHAVAGDAGVWIALDGADGRSAEVFRLTPCS